jgi:hypothetical protein
MSEATTLAAAVRAYLDEGSDELLVPAWKQASDEERREALDQMVMDTLLQDALGGAASSSGGLGMRGVGGPQVLSAGRKPVEAGKDSLPHLPPGRVIAWRQRMLAAAALVLIFLGVGLWTLLPRLRHEALTAAGDFAVVREAGGRVQGGALRRGDVITAGRNGALLRLGGYCEVEMDAGTEVVLRGGPKKEEIELTDGWTLSHVTPGKGGFVVRTPRGNISVAGTEFITAVEHPATPDGDAEMNKLKKAAVVTAVVLSGAVAYHFDTGSGELKAGMGQAFAGEAFAATSLAAQPAGNLMIGQVVSTSERSLTLALGKDRQETYVAPPGDSPAILNIADLKPGDRVTVVWRMQGEQKEIAKISGQGNVTGSVLAKGADWIEVAPKDGKAQKFMAAWAKPAAATRFGESPSVAVATAPPEPARAGAGLGLGGVMPDELGPVGETGAVGATGTTFAATALPAPPADGALVGGTMATTVPPEPAGAGVALGLGGVMPGEPGLAGETGAVGATGTTFAATAMPAPPAEGGLVGGVMAAPPLGGDGRAFAGTTAAPEQQLAQGGTLLGGTAAPAESAPLAAAKDRSQEFDVRVLAIIAAQQIGDSVTLTWQLDEGKRVVSIKSVDTK